MLGGRVMLERLLDRTLNPQTTDEISKLKETRKGPVRKRQSCLNRNQIAY